MYKRVPPPSHTNNRNQEVEYEERGTACTGADIGSLEKDEAMPMNVDKHQWKKFQELKARRARECGQTEKKRKERAIKRVLMTVSGKLTDSDKELLAADGVTLPATNKRHKKESYEVQEPSRDVERKWNEVRSLMDPNPQLQGMHKGRFSNKSKLEKSMDKLIEEGQFKEAASISDKLAQREFATKVSKAFDCLEYSKRKKEDEDRKKISRKKSSSRHVAMYLWSEWADYPLGNFSSSFSTKHRWECKANM